MSNSKIVFPLDVASEEEAWVWCRKLHGEVGVMKVGLELFIKEGPKVLTAVKAGQFRLFLDLKLHDIPVTVRNAAQSAASHGAELITVHASGGPAMLKAAVQGALQGHVRDNSPTPIILAVTVLTSMSSDDWLETTGLDISISTLVERMAVMAWNQGVRGFVCSPQEVGLLRRILGPEALLVVPGVRPAGSAEDDQKRIATPGQAVKDGADLLVIGRPIRNAPDPVKAAREITNEINAV